MIFLFAPPIFAQAVCPRVFSHGVTNRKTLQRRQSRITFALQSCHLAHLMSSCALGSNRARSDQYSSSLIITQIERPESGQTCLAGKSCLPGNHIVLVLSRKELTLSHATVSHANLNKIIHELFFVCLYVGAHMGLGRTTGVPGRGRV